MSTTDTTPADVDTTGDTPAGPSASDPVNDAVMGVLGGFASICGAPDDPDVAAAANAALRDLDLLVAAR